MSNYNELHAVHLYIDSFDEGLEIEKKRETLVKGYIMFLKTTTVKVLITCRSDYLENDDSTRWFTPQDNAFDKLTTSYVAPMDYTAGRKAEKNDSKKEETKENEDQDGPNWKKNVTAYLELKREKENSRLNKKTQEESLEKEEKRAKKEDTKENGDQDGTNLKRNVTAYLELKREKENSRLNKKAQEETLEKIGNRVPKKFSWKENFFGACLGCKWGKEEPLLTLEKKENTHTSESSMKEKVTTYLELKQEKENTQLNQMTLEETLEKMSILNLDKLIDTGLMFHIIMEVLFDLFDDENQSRSRSKQDIYLKYITKYQKRG